MTDFTKYQIDQYIHYLNAHNNVLEGIYKHIESSPLKRVYLASLLGYNYYQFNRRMRNKSLTVVELLKLLKAI